MTDSHQMQEYCRKVINGFGERVSNIDKAQGVLEVRTKRSEDDLEKVWENVEKLADTSANHMEKMRKENEKNNKDMLIKIVFIYAGGILMMFLKDMFLKGA